VGSTVPTDTTCKLHAAPKAGGAATVLANLTDCSTIGTPGGLVVDGNDVWIASTGSWQPPWNLNAQPPPGSTPNDGALYHVDLTKPFSTNTTKVSTPQITCALSKNCLSSDATSLYYFERVTTPGGPSSPQKDSYVLQRFTKSSALVTSLVTLPTSSSTLNGGSIAVSGNDVWYTGITQNTSAILGHVSTIGGDGATIGQFPAGVYFDVVAETGQAFVTRGVQANNLESSASINGNVGDAVLRFDTKARVGVTSFDTVFLKPTRVVPDGDVVYLIAPHNIFGFDRASFQ
jgi:hypothetical protein